MPDLSRQDAAKELLRRKAIRNELTSWANFVVEEKGLGKPAAHHCLLMEYLQLITDGELIDPKSGRKVRRLMVLMPPGSAKSTYTSIIYPPWAIQRRFNHFKDRNCRLLTASYAADLIESFSRECRNLVDAYGNLLGYRLDPNSRAVSEWSTTCGATYRCGGVGGGFSGRRADIGLIDDYIGTEEDADSKTIRDKQWKWFNGDFWPRLKPGGICIIVANRRHEDDLVGRLIARDGDKWMQVLIPFFADDNDPLGREKGARLWPEWFTEEMANDIKRLPPRTVAGLYNQKPAPDDGDYFTRDMLNTYSRETYDKLMQSDPRIYAAGDWAVSTEKDSNKTCFGPVAVNSKGQIFFLPDLYWKIADPREVVQRFAHMIQARAPIITWSEKGHISMAWGPFLKEYMNEQDIFGHIKEVTPSKDKQVRARSIQARMAMGNVFFPDFADWWPAAMHQMLTFPGSTEDDFVDFIAHIGMGLNSILKANTPPEPDPSDEEVLAIPFRPTIRWLKQQESSYALDKLIKYHAE